MVEQLKRLPVQIFTLSLLLSSKAHRNALLKILYESHIPEGIATKDLEHTVGQIIGTNTITFKEDELTLEGRWHIKSLHITVGYRGMIILRVLIDNSSALNVCPVMILGRIGVEGSMIRLNGMMVRAFDGTKTFACGKADLKSSLVRTNLKYLLLL